MFARNSKTRKASENGNKPALLLRAALAGASRPEWVFTAIRELKEEAIDRVGVWLEEPYHFEAHDTDPLTLRGETWEHGIGNGPAAWTRLMAEAPLPVGLLSRGIPCEYKPGGAYPPPILGPFVDLRHILLLPITRGRLLRGMVMLGARDIQEQWPRSHAQSIAAQLGLLLELEQARKLAAARKADLELVQRIHRLLLEDQNSNMILGQLVESCTRGASFGGAGAVFALIAEHKPTLPPNTSSESPAQGQLLIRAQSGEAAWAHGIDRASGTIVAPSDPESLRCGHGAISIWTGKGHLSARGHPRGG